MRISDWSSDVCSSDLVGERERVDDVEAAAVAEVDERVEPQRLLEDGQARDQPRQVVDGEERDLDRDVAPGEQVERERDRDVALEHDARSELSGVHVDVADRGRSWALGDGSGVQEVEPHRELAQLVDLELGQKAGLDRKSTRLNSSH